MGLFARVKIPVGGTFQSAEAHERTIGFDEQGEKVWCNSKPISPTCLVFVAVRRVEECIDSGLKTHSIWLEHLQGPHNGAPNRRSIMVDVPHVRQSFNW